MPATRHLNGVLLAGPWWPVFSGIWIHSLTTTKKTSQSWTPSEKTFWISAWNWTLKCLTCHWFHSAISCILHFYPFGEMCTWSTQKAHKEGSRLLMFIVQFEQICFGIKLFFMYTLSRGSVWVIASTHMMDNREGKHLEVSMVLIPLHTLYNRRPVIGF